MSRVICKKTRSLRGSAGMLTAIAALMAGGCSSTSERWSTGLGESGYEQKTTSTATSAGPDRFSSGGQRRAWSPIEKASYTPGSETQLQVARVDLAPLPDTQAQSPGDTGRVKTADGYGSQNRGPLSDGVYSGPRVYTPYDRPRDESPPPSYRSEQDNDEPRRAERDRGSAPFYGRSEAPRVYERVPSEDRPRDRVGGQYDLAPPLEKRGDERRYDPNPDARADARRYAPPAYREGERSFYGRPAYNDPNHAPDVAATSEASTIKRPSDPVAGDRGNGKVVTVAAGQTLYTLAIRYGVTVKDIVDANGLQGRSIKPGQDLLIPSRGSLSVSVPASPKPDAVACKGARCHVVRKGDTVASLSRAYNVSEARILAANTLDGTRSLALGTVLIIPTDGADLKDKAKLAPETEVTKATDPTQRTENRSTGAGAEAATKPSDRAPERVIVASAAGADASCDASLANPLPRSGNTFRKPVEGLIISQFGPQRNGVVNEGLTISVPKGTPVKAAENGVVAYVGDELPGFGKLVLIRHADDYVTAYAHADEILVKRCDVIKRGQIVAKAGATGDVTQPQLHFEIRKNSKPVDPTSLLSS